ncbi:enoyl-CoA hydratase [Caballeronia sordidicola]|uniref:Enoyl-CoA hydratase n=1 Tax=Caballeronia sordidicola TaxID=196367 RepID=A0A158F3Q3_CABSO|nr:enoyl-CoA hydratase [Caballeronia sordidicola]SAL14477.1 enoyl-CoA hydratase [Caballeronia sordidicola]
MDIITEHADNVLCITINRPARKNALTAEMYQTMADAFFDAENDPSVRAVLIRAVGDTFSAGNDLEDFMKAPPAKPDAPVFQFLRRISTAQKPVVAAVNGGAVGIGTTMLLHCDLVYAASTAKFALPFVQLGLCPEAASSLLLPRIAGYQRAAEKLLLGESFDANEAVNMGIVNRILSAEEVGDFAFRQAKKLAALPPASLKATKALMKGGEADEVSAQMANEAGHFASMLTSPEAKEAFTAFFEKRKPDFSRFN